MIDLKKRIVELVSKSEASNVLSLYHKIKSERESLRFDEISSAVFSLIDFGILQINDERKLEVAKK